MTTIKAPLPITAKAFLYQWVNQINQFLRNLGQFYEGKVKVNTLWYQLEKLRPQK